MRAAAALARDNASILQSALDEARVAQMTRALIHTVLGEDAPPDNAPGVRPVITDAVTPKGEISLIAENAQPRVIRLCRHWAMDVTPILRAVSCAAQSAGYSVEEHLYPAVPGMLLHLTIPALRTLLTTSDLLPSEQTFDFSACLPPSALLRHECTLEQGRAGIRMHMHRAVSAMAQAKQLHDEMETFYVPNMDFALWQKQLDRLLEMLETSKKNEP